MKLKYERGRPRREFGVPVIRIGRQTARKYTRVTIFFYCEAVEAMNLVDVPFVDISQNGKLKIKPSFAGWPLRKAGTQTMKVETQRFNTQLKPGYYQVESSKDGVFTFKPYKK